MKKIIFITGSLPPEPCGVGDYSQKLINELKKYYEVDVILMNNFSLRKLYQYYRKLKNEENSVKILQYPTLGYGWSIFPQILSIIFGNNMYINLHEFSNRTLKAKLATTLFLFGKSKLIVTTNDEKNYIEKNFKLLKKNVYIVNIGSNIPFYKNSKKDYDLIYFGLIMRGKGIEDYFKLVEKIRAEKKSYKCLIIGKKKEENYFKECEEKSLNLDIKIYEGLTEEKVGNILSRSRVAFLPFPDGATLRRGSLIACLGNGVEVITYKNKITKDNEFLDKRVWFSQNIDDSYNFLENILEKKHYKKVGIEDRFSWKSILEKIKEILKKEEK